MTRRSSVRAQARDIYRDLAAGKVAAPDPPSQSFGGASPSPEGETNLTAQNLTEKVRALYEDSAVPVREIASVTGVTERTIYKYAAKHHWQPRYRWAPDRTCRSWRAGAAFAPVKGAGARFIRRDDKDKPFATGLKATDPEGAVRAAVACGEAAQLAEQAQRQAEAAQRQAQQARRAEATIRAIDWTNRALKDLREFRARRDKHPGPFDDRVERILTQMVTVALSRWEALQAEQERQDQSASS